MNQLLRPAEMLCEQHRGHLLLDPGRQNHILEIEPEVSKVGQWIDGHVQSAGGPSLELRGNLQGE